MRHFLTILLVACAANDPEAQGRLIHGARISAPFPEPIGVSPSQSIAAACGVQSAQTYFRARSAEPNDPELDQLAACLAKGALKDKQITLIGYTSPVGEKRELAIARAEAVASYLEERGVASTRIRTNAHSGDASHSRGPAGYAFDRRVDITVP